MKILIIRTFPDRLNLNSYNVQEIGLARSLVAKGYQCDVVLYGGKKKDRREMCSFAQNGEEYSFFIYWLKGYSVFKNGFMPSVKNLIDQYDIIQVHEYDQILSWILYSKPKKPTIVYHGPYYHPYTKGYNLKCRVFDLMFFRRRNYDHVIALTKSKLAAEFLKTKGFNHVFPVGVGVNGDNFRLLGKDSYNTLPKREKNKFQLLYVGKIEERRNVYFLIEVFKRLLQIHPNIQLSIIGDGENKYREAFLNSIDKELEEQTILYRQKATQAELSDIYMTADVFLFTTNYDIFGMVLLEAMYFGLPVISTLNGGSSMLIQDGLNGYILDDTDIKQWVDHLSTLITDRDKLTSMGQCAKETIRSGFTWEHLVGKFETAYHEAIEMFDQYNGRQ